MDGTHLVCLAAAVLELLATAPASARDRFDRVAYLGWPSEYRQGLRNVGQVLDEKDQNKETATTTIASGDTPGGPEAPSNKLSFSFTGQINRAVMHADDGHTQKHFNVDNNHSSTRAAVFGVMPTESGVTLGSTIEVGLNSESSSAAGQAPNAPDISLGVTLRKAEIFAISERFGTFWIGRGSTAADGTAEVDLSGTRVAGNSNIPALGGGISFADSGTIGSDGKPRVRSVFSNLDGGRTDRLRYGSRSLRGVALATSWSAGGRWDVAITSASASYVHESGWSGTLSLGRRTFKSETRANATYYYDKLGYRREIFGFGLTKLSIDFGENDDLQRNGDSAKFYGAQLVQDTGRRYELELYLSYRNYSLERPDANFDDINVVLAGARARF